MPSRWLVGALLIALFAPARTVAARELVPGLVALQIGSPAADGAIISSRVPDQLAALGWVVTQVAPHSERRAALVIAGDPQVRAATPIYRYPAQFTPNDRFYPVQYHHVTMGSAAAWDHVRGSAAMPIAILDTGVAAHVDLAAKLLSGWNFYDDNADTRDVHGHGTAVAGAAAAIGNNVEGVAGMAWLNPILPVRIAAPDGFARSDTIAAAMRWAADRGARIINVSFGPLQGDALVSSAARYARQHGALVFAAAGNEGQRDPTAADPSILFVSATDRNDLPAAFTTTGPAVRFAAPGVGIATTAQAVPYASYSGTSFSSPLAAGAAALVWSANPSLTADQVEQLLASTARDLGPLGRDDYYGSGRIDVAAAVRAALATLPSPPPPPPSSTPIPSSTPSPTPSSTPTPTSSPTPTPTQPPAPLPILLLKSPGPNGFWMGPALTVVWQVSLQARMASVSALVDGSLRASSTRINGAIRGNFQIRAFPSLTRGRHVLRLIGVTQDGREVYSGAYEILRP